MKNKFYVLAVAVCALLIGSCTMEKRVYSSGYNVQWKKSKNSSAPKEINLPQAEPMLTASVENCPEILPAQPLFTEEAKTTKTEARAKDVVEVNSNTVNKRSKSKRRIEKTKREETGQDSTKAALKDMFADLTDKDKKFEGFTLAALGIATVAVISLASPFVSIIAILLALIAIPFAALGYFRIRLAPGRRKSKLLFWLTMTFVLLAIVFGLALL